MFFCNKKLKTFFDKIETNKTLTSTTIYGRDEATNSHSQLNIQMQHY